MRWKSDVTELSLGGEKENKQYYNMFNAHNANYLLIVSNPTTKNVRRHIITTSQCGLDVLFYRKHYNWCNDLKMPLSTLSSIVQFAAPTFGVSIEFGFTSITKWCVPSFWFSLAILQLYVACWINRCLRRYQISLFIVIANWETYMYISAKTV